MGSGTLYDYWLNPNLERVTTVVRWRSTAFEIRQCKVKEGRVLIQPFGKTPWCPIINTDTVSVLYKKRKRYMNLVKRQQGLIVFAQEPKENCEVLYASELPKWEITEGDRKKIVKAQMAHTMRKEPEKWSWQLIGLYIMLAIVIILLIVLMRGVH